VRAFRLYLKFRLQSENVNYSPSATRFRAWVYEYRWLLWWKPTAVLFVCEVLVVVAITVGILLTAEPSSMTLDIGGECLGNLNYLILVEGSLGAIALVLSVALLWRVRDAYAFKAELKLMVVLCPPILVLWAIDNFCAAFPVTVPTATWAIVVIVLSMVISLVFPTALTFSARYNPRQLRLRLSNSTVLPDPSSLTSKRPLSSFEGTSVRPGTREFFEAVMADPVMLEAFKRFAVESWCVENIRFYLDTADYAAIPVDDTAAQRAKAKEIQAQYLLASSPLLINIEPETLSQVNEQISSGRVTPDLFAASAKKVTRIMREDTFMKFTSTSAFLAAYRRSALNTEENLEAGWGVKQPWTMNLGFACWRRTAPASADQQMEQHGDVV
jgi:hypothetical protein